MRPFGAALALVAGVISGMAPTADAALAFVQTASAANGGNGSSIAATFAATPTAGNLLIAVAANRGSSTPSTPAGWSVAIDESASSPGQVIFYKIAGASEAATVTIGGYSTATRLGLQLYEYSGVDRRAPLDQTASSSGSSATPSTAATAVTTSANEVLVAGFVLDSSDTFASWTSSFTERNDFQNGGAPSSAASYAGADRIVSAPGTYSTGATATGSAAWRGQIATFRGFRRVVLVGRRCIAAHRRRRGLGTRHNAVRGSAGAIAPTCRLFRAR
jgi:hypothetical protein